MLVSLAARMLGVAAEAQMGVTWRICSRKLKTLYAHVYQSLPKRRGWGNHGGIRSARWSDRARRRARRHGAGPRHLDDVQQHRDVLGERSDTSIANFVRLRVAGGNGAMAYLFEEYPNAQVYQSLPER